MRHNRRLKFCLKCHVPEEIWREILCMLPVKPLVRFRCVSRSWKVLIDEPEFAQLHITRFSNKQPESQILISQYQQFQEHTKCYIRCSKTLKIMARLGFLESDISSIETLRTTPGSSQSVVSWCLFCSIDGLFVLRSRSFESKVMLWNPSIRKTLLIPPSPDVIFNQKLHYTDLGLGFDPLVKDYKLVRFFMTQGGSLVHCVAIYTLGANLWKMFECQGEGSVVRGQRVVLGTDTNTVCVRGVLYTLANDNRDIYNGGDSYLNLVLFDLKREFFDITLLPSMQNAAAIRFTRNLTVMDEGHSVALVDLWGNGGSIRVLESSGDDLKSPSWINRYIFSTIIEEPPRYGPPIRTSFVYLKSNGEILVKWKLVLSHNLETQEEKILMKRGLGDDRAWLYRESLLLLTRIRNV